MLTGGASITEAVSFVTLDDHSDRLLLCGICLIAPAALEYAMSPRLAQSFNFVDVQGYCCERCATRVLHRLQPKDLPSWLPLESSGAA